ITYSSNIHNPILFRLLKSQILLPTLLLQTINHKQIQYIILHQLSHLKTHHLIFNHLYLLFKMIFSFNPPLYITK
ncbi:M56 family metallopeptidase, partial [Staphylococcus epidermidis]|uniref:M56 family metallopeptidase n=1 Tax=Staphylococcus epidermidis TaxID=1282 RepID=UPI0028CBA4D2